MCERTTMLPSGVAMSYVLLCDNCEGETHLGCTNLREMPAPDSILPCRSCEDRDICAVCGFTTLDRHGIPLPNVLVCRGCDCEVHLCCSGVGRLPTPETPFTCSSCGGSHICAMCGTTTAQDELVTDVLLCGYCGVEIHLRCSGLDNNNNKRFIYPDR